MDISIFSCRCGCGYNVIQPSLVKKLERLIRITEIKLKRDEISGCRCPAHNKAEGGVPASPHITGEAIDLPARNSTERFNIVAYALLIGFNRVGIGNTFVHLDIANDDKHPQNVMWRY